MNTEYTYDIKQFTYNKQTNTLSADAVQLYTSNQDGSIHQNPFPNGKQQFNIKNYQTGNHRRFRFVKEGELSYLHTVIEKEEEQTDIEVTSQPYWLYEAEDGVMCRVYLP
jgi:glutathionylspermidine synthase